MSKKTKKIKKFKKMLKSKNFRIAAISVMALVVVGVAFGLLKNVSVEAAISNSYSAYYGVGSEFKNEYVVNNKVYTPTNKMKILEIVPSAEQGELGYLCGNGENDGFVSIPDISKIKDSVTVNYAGSTQKVRDVLVAYRNDQLSFLIHGNCDLSDKGYFYGDLGYSGEGGKNQNRYRLALNSLSTRAGYRTPNEYAMGNEGDIPLLPGYVEVQTGTNATTGEANYTRYYYRNYLAYLLFGNSYMENKLEVVVKGAGEVTPEDFDNCDMVYLSRAGHGNGNISRAIELMKTLTADDFTSDGEAIVAKYKNATFAESFSTTQTDIYGNVMDLSDEALAALLEFYASDRAFILDFSAKVEGTNVAKAVQVVGGISSSAFYKQFCKETANGETVNLGNGFTVNNLTGFYGEFGYYDSINKKFHIAFPDDGSWTNNGSDVWQFVEAGPQNWQSKYSFSYDYDKHKWKVNENTKDKLYVNFLGKNYEVTQQTKWMNNANVTAYFPSVSAFDVDSSLRYATTSAFGTTVSLSYNNGKFVNNTISSVPKAYATITADWGGGYVEFNGQRFQGQLDGDNFRCYNPITISLDVDDEKVTYLEKMPSSYIRSNSLGGYVIDNGTKYYGEIIDGTIALPDLYFQKEQLTSVTEEYDPFDYDRFGITIKDTSVPWSDDMFYKYIAGGIMRTVENINSPSPTVKNPCTDYYHATTNPNGQTDDSRYIYNGTSAFTMNLQKEADICDLSMQRLYKNSKDAYNQITYLYAPDGHPTGINVIQYLLGIFPGKSSEVVHVLEIQPAGYYDYSLYDTSMMTRKVKNFQTAIDLVSYIGGNSSMLTSKNYRNKVKIDSVSVSAFDGLNKDILTDYDLIIFGIKDGVSGNYVLNTNGSLNREESDILDYTALTATTYRYDKAYSINTDRRDDALDGLIYNTVGDIYQWSVGNGSQLQNLQALNATGYYDDYTVPGYARASGNDLTNKAYDKLIQYCNEKEMPIIFADDIYNGNKTKIGSTTNVYKLSEYSINSNVATVEEASRTHELGLKNAYWHVLDQRLYFDITKPVNLAYKAGSDGLVDLVSESDSTVIYKEIDEDVDIEFEGSIRGSVKPVASTYYYTLYIDKNGDGIYRTDVVRDDHNEVFASGELVVSPTGVLESMTVDGEEEGFDAVILNADDDTTGSFSLKVTLTESMTGYMRWRLVVEEMTGDGSGIISDTNGEFIVLDKQKKTVNVLQLIPDTRTSRKTAYKDITGGCVYAGNNTDPIRLILERPDENGTSFSSNKKSVLHKDNYLFLSSITTDMLNSSKKFNELFDAASAVTGIDMKVTTLTTTAYEDMFLYLHDDKMDYLLDANGNKQRDLNETVNYRSSEDYDDKLRNPLKAMKMDMVVIGFADNYARDALGDNQGAISCLKEFAARGKSILFSHDTFPYSGYSDGYMTATRPQIQYGDNVALNTMTNMLRSVSGQDRYGTTEALDSEGNPDPNSYYWTSAAEGKLPTIEIDGEIKSYAELGQLQGYSNIILYRHGQMLTADGKVDKLKPKFSSFYNGLPDAVPDLNYTSTVTRTNQGQVTQYPYLIKEKLSVAKTHSQWYSVDLEAKENKSEEVVVWFALSDGGNNDEGAFMANKGLDPINDYYIFSKGTITYSGAGHSLISTSNVAEQKLFINTIIRALVAANSAPKASFETAVLTDELKDEYTQYIRKPLQDSDVAIDEKGHLQSLIVSFKGKDADMRKGNKDVAGQFTEAYVYWDVNKNGRFDIEDVKLETYPSATQDYAYNNIPIDIDLFNYRDVKDSKGNKLGDSVNNNTCQLGVVFRDSQDSGSATCKLVLRELFELN